MVEALQEQQDLDDSDQFVPLSDDTIGLFLENTLAKMDAHPPASRLGYISRETLRQLLKGIRPRNYAALVTEQDKVLNPSDAVTDLDPIFFCSLCANVARDPISCKNCQHVTCKACGQREYAGKQCSNCSENWNMAQMQSEMLDKLLDASFKCNKCDRVFKYSQHEQHLTQICSAFSRYSCNAPNCQDSSRLFDTLEALMEGHWKTECEEVLEKCRACLEPLYDSFSAQGDQQDHDCADAIGQRILRQAKHLDELEKEKAIMLEQLANQAEVQSPVIVKKQRRRPKRQQNDLRVKIERILGVLGEAPAELRGVVIEKLKKLVAVKQNEQLLQEQEEIKQEEEVIQQKNAGGDEVQAVVVNRINLKVKTCPKMHPLKNLASAKLRQHGDDYIEGKNLSCDVCGERIDIDQGYMTCEDVCDFDIHAQCFDQRKEREIHCRGGTLLIKREPGFRKESQVLADGIQTVMQIEMQFCNSCDELIIFAEAAYYTCDGKCDFFICTTCAECPQGHKLKLVWEKQHALETRVACSKCQKQIFGANDKSLPIGMGEGYHRCQECQYELCTACLIVYSKKYEDQ